jgi:hypothetical protein
MPGEAGRAAAARARAKARRMRERVALREARARDRNGLGPLPSRLEACLEAAVLHRMGWDVARFHGKTRTDRLYEPMRIVAPGRTLLRPRSRLFDAIVLGCWCRFGNAVAQLVNAAHYARRFGAERILVPPGHDLFLPSGELDGTPFAPGSIADLRRGETALVGRLYDCRPFDDRPSPEARYAAARALVAPLLRPDLLQPDPRVGDDDVVAHLRSGDIFERPDPNRNYGQPPLSFYLAAILARPSRRVWLVYENQANPVISALAARLRALGAEVVEQSASLAEDLRVMLTARRLVMGYGTLTDSVAALSTRLAEAHVFGRHRDIRPPGSAIALARWVDRGGRFVDAVQSRNWHNTPAQRQLLLDYPLEALELVAEGPRPA